MQCLIIYLVIGSYKMSGGESEDKYKESYRRGRESCKL